MLSPMIAAVGQLLLLLAPLTHAATPSSTAPTATINNGVVIGTATTLPGPAVVNKYLGIPFAVSPPLRFGAPVAAANFKGAYNAQSPKPACVQEFVGPANAQQFSEGIFNSPPPPAGESEDCLYLNVFVPSSTPPAGGRAVLFWLFGGGYAFGTGTLDAYDGSAFAAYQDVIVVSPNYRTNVFGFSNSPQIPLGQQNSGYLDQRLALQWVQQNIAAFGGNPKAVTIFGESAGGWSVDNLISTYTTETAPFRAGIMESGQLTYMASPIPTNSSASWTALIKSLNCTNTDQLACARNASAATIKSVIEQKGIHFYPVADNVTRASSPASRRASGQFAKVPIMIGSNANEGRVFEYGMTDFPAFLKASLNVTAPALIPKILKAYPTGNISTDVAGGNTPYDRISEIATYLAFQCGTNLLANLSMHVGVPVWQYYYNATFPNLATLNNALGVYHSSEISLVWGTYPGGPVHNVSATPNGLLPNNLPPTAQQIALSKYMNTAWASFAKNPTGGPGWAALSTGKTAILGQNNSTGATLVSRNKFVSPCSLLLPAFTALTGPAYGLPN